MISKALPTIGLAINLGYIDKNLIVPDKTPPNDDEPRNAYSELGLSSEASFEDIQKAREKKLSEAGDDVLKKAKIESSYDSLLMESLKARQLGNVSNDALSASKKENNGFEKNITSIGNSLLTRLKNNNSYDSSKKEIDNNSFISIPQGEGLVIRISLGILILVLFLISPDRNIQLILSISTIGLFVSQVKRGRKLFQSLGWSVVFLSSGYILGGIIVNGLAGIDKQALILSLDKLEALPALLLLWIGSLLLA